MVPEPRYPSLFQINTRVWLGRLSREAGKRITLADIDDTTIDGFAEKGFDWVWLLSVWQIGAAGRAVSSGSPQWRAGDHQQVGRVARQAVNGGDDNHVAMRENGGELFKLRPVGGRAGDLLAENLLATGCLELGRRAGEVLRLGRDAGITPAAVA